MYNWILLYVYWVNGLAFASRCLAKQWYSLYLNIHLYMTWPLVTDDVYVISMHDDISMLIFMIDSPRPKNIVILCTGKVDFGEKCPKNWCCSFVFFTSQISMSVPVPPLMLIMLKRRLMLTSEIAKPLDQWPNQISSV